MDPFSSSVCIQKTTRRLPARDPPWLHESIICFDLPSFWVLKRAPTFISVQYAFAFISEIRENIWCSQGHLRVQEHYFSLSERRGPTGGSKKIHTLYNGPESTENERTSATLPSRHTHGSRWQARTGTGPGAKILCPVRAPLHWVDVSCIYNI